MWLLAETLAADPAPSGANDSFIVVVGGIVIAAIGALGLVLVEYVKGRNSRSAGPPQVSPTVDVLSLAQDVAVLKDWRVNVREADNIHDHTVTNLIGTVDDVKADLGDVLRWMDREHPEWRP